jgi:hypothetical protein
MEHEFPVEIFEKYSNKKNHENLSSGIRVFPCGRTDRHGEAKVAFRNFVSARKKKCSYENLE